MFYISSIQQYLSKPTGVLIGVCASNRWCAKDAFQNWHKTQCFVRIITFYFIQFSSFCTPLCKILHKNNNKNWVNFLQAAPICLCHLGFMGAKCEIPVTKLCAFSYCSQQSKSSYSSPIHNFLMKTKMISFSKIVALIDNVADLMIRIIRILSSEHGYCWFWSSLFCLWLFL